MEGVVVANFSSLLEIIFAINILTVWFEFYPHFDERFQKMSEEFNDVSSTAWWNASRDGIFNFARLDIPAIVHIGLSAWAIIVSIGVSATAVGLLIGSGFDKEFAIERKSMITMLAVGFGCPTAYYLLNYWLLSVARNQYLALKKKQSETPNVEPDL